MTQEMIKRKDVWRTLKTHFKEKEKLIMAEQIAGCIRERNRLEEDLASVKAQYTSDIKKQEAEISSLAERFNTGWEMRRIECEEIKDFNNGTVRIWRKDTGLANLSSLIEERAMSGEERQMRLFEEKEAPAGEGSSPKSELGAEGAEATPGPPFNPFPEFGETEEVPGTLPPPIGIPHQSLQDEREGGQTPENVSTEGVGPVNLKEISDNSLKDIDKKDLPEDTSPFYTGKKRGPKTKKMTLPE